MILALFPWPALASAGDPGLPKAYVAEREHAMWTATKRDAEFSAIAHTARRSCEATHPPEALATPSPLLEQSDPSTTIKVSFIIGTDGRVHSPFILESAGSSADRIVLDTVRSWRYRPATCNGVPTEAEARIGFSSR
jgi:TonB family protein